MPTAGAIKAGQLLVVGLGDRDSLTLERVRRAAGVAARNIGNAASVALALPAHDAEHVRAVADGSCSGGYSFKRYKSRSDDSGVAEVSDPQRRRAAPGRDRGAGDRRRPSATSSTGPATG